MSIDRKVLEEQFFIDYQDYHITKEYELVSSQKKLFISSVPYEICLIFLKFYVEIYLKVRAAS